AWLGSLVGWFRGHPANQLADRRIGDKLSMGPTLRPRRSPDLRTASPPMNELNPPADWLNLRGTWVTNVLIAVVLRVLFACVPGMSNEAAWTLTNLTYNSVSNLRARQLVFTIMSNRRREQFMFFFFH